MNQNSNDTILNPNVGNGNGNDLNEWQLENIALKAKVQMLEAANKQLVEKYAKLESEMREKEKSSLEQPPANKARVEESVNVHANEATKAMEEGENNEESETSLDLPRRRRLPLPLELNCEIFQCLKFPIQRKFIWRLSREMYQLNRQKMLIKSRRLRNRKGNTGSHKDSFHVGLSNSDGEDRTVGKFSDTYGIKIMHNGVSKYCNISGKKHRFEWPKGAIKPEWNEYEDVIGCGILLDPKDNVAIFFTLNGILLGKQISISPSVSRLYPNVLMQNNMLEANFGAKSFCYDIKKCPGMGFADDDYFEGPDADEEDYDYDENEYDSDYENEEVDEDEEKEEEDGEEE